MNMPVSSPRSSAPTAGKLPCIVCCTSAQKTWDWLPEELDEKPRQWFFCNDQPQGVWEKWIRFPNLAAMRASWQAVRLAKRNQADLLLSGNPVITFWCALFSLFQGLRTYHVALSFYLPRLPSGIQYLLAQLAYSRVNRAIVHSRAERQIYGEHFGIPAARFEMQHWGNVPPQVQPMSLEPGEYICAMGEQPQDYQTLLAAIATLPEIPLVLVVPKGRAVTANIAPNVTIRAGLSVAQQMNILQHSRFLVSPIRHSRTPCDHAALVAAMQLGKTFITSELPSVSDYAFHNSNAILCPPSNPQALAAAIRGLWNNVVRCEILGENGKEFAEAFCSEASTRHYFLQLLIRRGL